MRIADNYDLTIEQLKDGETAEFQPVEKPKRKGGPYYDAGVVDAFVGDALDDLRDTIIENENLHETLDTLQSQNDELQMKIDSLQKQAELKQQDIDKLKSAEKVLDNLEKAMNKYKAKQNQDSKQIQDLHSKLQETQNNLQQAKNNPEISRLQQRINELEEQDRKRDADYQSLANDVNTVLDALESKFSNLPQE